MFSKERLEKIKKEVNDEIESLSGFFKRATEKQIYYSIKRFKSESFRKGMITGALITLLFYILFRLF